MKGFPYFPKISFGDFPVVPGLLGLALVLLTAAAEVKDGQLEALEEAVQALQRQDGLVFGRQERSAEPGKKGKKKKSKNGAKKMKKNKNKGMKKGKQTKKRGKKNQGKVNRKGKKNNRNGKGNKRAKENRNARNRNNRKKKNKKGSKKEKVKGKAQKRKNMKQRKQIQTKGKGKKDKKNRNKNKIIRDSCLPLVCINNAVKSMTIVKGKIFSFEKQLKRFEKMSKQAVNKVGKKHVFKPALMRLQHHGGGNASELSCGGNKTNAGALQMQNLTNLLTACEDQVSTNSIHQLQASIPPQGARGVPRLQPPRSQRHGVGLLSRCHRTLQELRGELHFTDDCNCNVRLLRRGQRDDEGDGRAEGVRPQGAEQQPHGRREVLQERLWHVQEVRRRRQPCDSHLRPGPGRLEEKAEEPERKQGRDGQDLGHHELGS